MKGSQKTQTPEAEKKTLHSYAVVAAASAVLVLLMIGLILFAAKAQSDKKALRSQLSEAEKKLELQEDVMAAWEAQQNEQMTLIEKLQSQVEDLLNVQEEDPVITSDQIAAQINSVKELVTKEYIYTNAARWEDSKTWLWGWTLPFSDSSLLVTYDGTIRAGIDLNQVRVEVNEDARVITVTLPPSRIISNEIPQGSIEVLEVKDNLFNKVTFDNYNDFIHTEQEAMAEKVTERGLLADADGEAKAVIQNALNLLPGMDTYKLEIK